MPSEKKTTTTSRAAPKQHQSDSNNNNDDNNNNEGSERPQGGSRGHNRGRRRGGGSSGRGKGRSNRANNNHDDDDEAAVRVASSSGKRANGGSSSTSSCPPYPSHVPLEECLARYEQGLVLCSATTNATCSTTEQTKLDQHQQQQQPLLLPVIRGKLRVLPGSMDTGASFVSDDQGRFARDVWIPDAAARNRALDGDTVYVELLSPMEETSTAATKAVADADHDDEEEEEAGDDIVVDAIDTGIKSLSLDEKKASPTLWQDDEVQMDLWNPVVPIVRPSRCRSSQKEADKNKDDAQKPQHQGRVIHVVPPVDTLLVEEEPAEERAELSATTSTKTARRRHGGKPKIPTRNLVGHLRILGSGTVLLTPYDKSLPQFKCPAHFADRLREETNNRNSSNATKGDKKNGKQNNKKDDSSNKSKKNDSSDNANQEEADSNHIIYQAEYEYHSWKETHKWPPCRKVRRMGQAGIVEDEIQALLTENKVDHGEFPQAVVENVQDAVRSGLYHSSGGASEDNETKAHADNKINKGDNNSIGWRPTEAMYHGRRDYRHERIFTIDPTTAKDLDDALHIKLLEDGKTVEVGVHIADVSFFVRPRTAVDQEAKRRATTVYLVDRTVPMLPRPLCEVACSLNENVERLAFSCVWKMNLDGTMVRSKKKKNKQGDVQDEVWYGRTVIKSCARLDYATAQNIIDGKVAASGATKEENAAADEEVWPKSRRPTGGHTMAQVASDVRLMHRVAMARRRLRFDNGALALHGVKISFQLDKSDGQTPLLAAPYPIRDSNRLVEEYMLLANYLVAQRLITHAGNRALLRHHPEPLEDGLDDVAAVAKAGIGFDLDITSSSTLHASLNRLARQCDDPLVLQSVNCMLMTPMKPADYIAAGSMESELWRHFALNIPYYTHFTSPIRRYPDVMVHRLLQATIDGEQAIKEYPLKPSDIQQVCDHCNEKRMASKAAQERCDRVFLALYVTANPLESELGIVLSVGMSTFTVFVPSIGVASLLYLEEHKDVLTFEPREEADESRMILLRQKEESKEASQHDRWNVLEIRVFTKLLVTVYGKEQPPIDVKLRLEGPWREQ